MRAPANINVRTGAVTYGPAVRLPRASSVLAANLATYNDATVAANSIYRYDVAALNGTVLGSVASTVATTATAIEGATGLLAGAVTTTSIGLQWQKSLSTLATGYQLQRCVAMTTTSCTTTAGTWVTLPLIAGVETTKYTDSGLATRTSYAYRISAISAATTPPLVSAPTVPVTLKTR
jgi:hypothetical protein